MLTTRFADCPFERSDASALGAVQDVPRIAGKVTWMLQLCRQLDRLEARLTYVLGSGWGDGEVYWGGWGM